MKRFLPIAVILTVFLIGALAVSPVFGGNGNGQEGLERAIAAQEKHTDALMAKEGVVGTAVGLNPAGKVAVLVFTTKAGVGGIPNELEGVPVAVRVTGEFVALAGPPAPVASFTVSCNGLSCDFDGSGSSGRKLGFEWDFQNNDSIDDTSGKQVNNVYLVPATYTVLLRVTDGKDDRLSHETTQMITVFDDGTSPPDTPAPVDPKSWFDRPVPIGVSSGNEYLVEIGGNLFCTVGTITARFIDTENKVYAGSNNHVYALENGANVKDDNGDSIINIIGSKVLQQGRVDTFDNDGNPCKLELSNEIGTLTAFVPIVFGGADNRVDAAIAESTTDQLGNATPSDGYGTPTSATVPVSELFFRQTVLKYGRTTGLTSGKMDAINATVNVGYDGGTARFVGQIIVRGRGFLRAGDSGSLLVTQSNEPIGLLFAGSNIYAIANQIDDVLAELSAELSTAGETVTLSIDDSDPDPEP